MDKIFTLYFLHFKNTLNCFAKLINIPNLIGDSNNVENNDYSIIKNIFKLPFNLLMNKNKKILKNKIIPDVILLDKFDSLSDTNKEEFWKLMYIVYYYANKMILCSNSKYNTPEKNELIDNLGNLLKEKYNINCNEMNNNPFIENTTETKTNNFNILSIAEAHSKIDSNIKSSAQHRILSFISQLPNEVSDKIFSLKIVEEFKNGDFSAANTILQSLEEIQPDLVEEFKKNISEINILSECDKFTNDIEDQDTKNIIKEIVNTFNSEIKNNDIFKNGITDLSSKIVNIVTPIVNDKSKSENMLNALMNLMNTNVKQNGNNIDINKLLQSNEMSMVKNMFGNNDEINKILQSDQLKTLLDNKTGLSKMLEPQFINNLLNNK